MRQGRLSATEARRQALYMHYLVGGVRGLQRRGFHYLRALSREEQVEMLLEQGVTSIRMYEMHDRLAAECQKQ